MKIHNKFRKIQLLFMPNVKDNNFDYYLSEFGMVVFIGKEKTTCGEGVFGTPRYFREWINKSNKDYGPYLTASGFKVLNGKEKEVIEKLIELDNI